jgi:hypothetical protein
MATEKLKKNNWWVNNWVDLKTSSFEVICHLFDQNKLYFHFHLKFKMILTVVSRLYVCVISRQCSLLKTFI